MVEQVNGLPSSVVPGSFLQQNYRNHAILTSFNKAPVPVSVKANAFIKSETSDDLTLVKDRHKKVMSWFTQPSSNVV